MSGTAIIDNMVETAHEDFVDDAELHAYAQHTLICPRSCTVLHTHNMDEANKSAMNGGLAYQKQIFTKDPKLSRKDKQRSCTISSRPMHSDSKSIRYTQKATSLNRLTPCLCQGCARPRTKEPLNPGNEGIGLDTYPLGIGPDIRPILLSNEALDSETLERFTTWGFVTEEILAALPAELVDPLRALEKAMAALHHACGATALNVVFNILTLSAWGNLRASELLPAFCAWVETGERTGMLETTPGFETPIEWPAAWAVRLQVEEEAVPLDLSCPLFILTLRNALCRPTAKERLSPVTEFDHDY